MANLVVNTLRVTGPVEDLERLKSAIETCAVEGGEGVQCLKEYHLDWEKWRTAFPDWGNFTAFGTLESRYSYEHRNHGALRPMWISKDDMLPVRIVNGAVLIRTVSNWDPPIAFIERLGALLPSLQVSGSSVETSSNEVTRWQSRARETERVELWSPGYTGEEICRWEKRGKVWKWSDERDADIEMMRQFLGLECAADPAELHTACRMAYDALALPGTPLCSRANGYAYSLACEIAEARRAVFTPWHKSDESGLANSYNGAPDRSDLYEVVSRGPQGVGEPKTAIITTEELSYASLYLSQMLKGSFLPVEIGCYRRANEKPRMFVFDPGEIPPERIEFWERYYVWQSGDYDPDKEINVTSETKFEPDMSSERRSSLQVHSRVIRKLRATRKDTQ